MAALITAHQPAAIHCPLTRCHALLLCAALPTWVHDLKAPTDFNGATEQAQRAGRHQMRLVLQPMAANGSQWQPMAAGTCSGQPAAATSQWAAGSRQRAKAAGSGQHGRRGTAMTGGVTSQQQQGRWALVY